MVRDSLRPTDQADEVCRRVEVGYRACLVHGVAANEKSQTRAREELAEHHSGVQRGARIGLGGGMVRLCEGVGRADSR